MLLDDRKKRILEAVIEEYNATAEPVGSTKIANDYNLGFSSATIRNEMASLEELGYLAQLHTSSGRVPSIDAYKLYVDELMDKGKLTSKEINVIKSACSEHADNLEEVVQNAVKVISELRAYVPHSHGNHLG